MPNSISPTKKLLAERIQLKRRELSQWQMEIMKKTPPPFYCSIDLRDSGHKIVPVDSNLYPAGFNNICPEDQRTAPLVLRAHLEAFASIRKMSSLTKVLIIPEAHTSNRYYIENLYYLRSVIQNANYEVQIGWYGEMPAGAPSEGPIKLVSASEKEVEAFPFTIQNGILSAHGFVPDVIILNNDFSSGYPKILDGVKQPILPSHTLGWHSRKKSEHFKYYNQLAGEFAQILGIDPWLIQIDTEEVGPVNFSEDQGIEEVAQSVERVIARTAEAYERHKVDTKPFVFVKNNAGTYGMGIMVVHSGDELRAMNRRAKNKMSVGKNKLPIESVAVQEGVPTATLVDRLAAEPVIYLFGGELIGGFLRTNTERGVEDNLNSQGMVFRMLCMSDLREHEEILDNPDTTDENKKAAQDDSSGNFNGDSGDEKSEEPLLEIVYGSIARISALAAGMELAAHATSGASASSAHVD